MIEGWFCEEVIKKEYEMAIKLRVGGYELQRCPFCGGCASINLDSLLRGGYVYAVCDRCGSRSRPFYTRNNYGVPEENDLRNGQYTDDAFEKAANAWNIRV